MNFNNLVAQLAHFAWGAVTTIVLAAYIPLLLAILAVAGGSAVKESVESIWGVWEPIQPWSDGAQDWFWFLVGIAAGVLFVRYGR